MSLATLTQANQARFSWRVWGGAVSLSKFSGFLLPFFLLFSLYLFFEVTEKLLI